MRDLFLVESPLQLLCAYEFLGRGESDFLLVVRLNGNSRNDEQMIVVADLLDLPYLPLKVSPESFFKDSLVESPALLKICSQRYRSIFIGSFFSRYFSLIRKCLRFDNLYMLDDGVATFLAQMRMNESNKTYDIATFFDVHPLEGQRKISHSFERIRSRFQSYDEAYSVFVGQPLVDRGMLTSEAYLYLVRAALDRSDAPLRYFPHRSESSSVLETVSSIPGVTIVKTDLCIELHLLKNKVRPSTVFSSVSSALFSLSSIFPDAKFFACMSQEFDSTNSPHINEIVSALKRSEKIEILEF